MTLPNRPTPNAANGELPEPDVDTVRTLLDHADRALLGATIALDDQDWRAPSTLASWTRGHVATHLCRHADGFGRLAAGALDGTEQEMYPGDRDAEIEQGAGRTGVELQTDLDTTIGQLAAAFDQLAAADRWQTGVRLRDGNRVPAGLLPAGRLFEVVLHHIDLDLGTTVDDIDTATALPCLRWAAVRQRNRTDYPALRLSVDSQDSAAPTIDIGVPDSDDPTVVRGPANRLLGWLTQRCDADGLRGAPSSLPTFG